MPSHVRTLCRTSVSVVWKADKCHCQAAEFMLHIYFNTNSKLYINYWIALNTPIQGKEFFLFPCLKILLGHSNRWTLCNRHEPSWGVRSNWEGREILAISPLPFPNLCTIPSRLNLDRGGGMGVFSFFFSSWVGVGRGGTVMIELWKPHRWLMVKGLMIRQ